MSYFYPALHNSSFKIPGGINKTDNKSDENFLIVQASTDKRYSEFIEINSDMKKKYSEFTKINFDISYINTIFTQVMSYKRLSQPGNMESPKGQDPDTVVRTNMKYPSLEGGNYTKIGGIWALNYDLI